MALGDINAHETLVLFAELIEQVLLESSVGLMKISISECFIELLLGLMLYRPLPHLLCRAVQVTVRNPPL